MTVQEVAGLISLIGGLLIIIIVAFLMVSATKSEDKHTAKEKVYKMRGRYLIGLTSVVVIIFFVTIQLVPYPSFQKEADEVVSVIAYQWAWRMAPGVYTDNPEKFTGTNEITLDANKNIKFVVTSNDVNHNFGIYNSKGDLVAQTQAMPGYHNELTYKFPEKGEYRVLCMEYCGMAHAFMLATIHVN